MTKITRRLLSSLVLTTLLPLSTVAADRRDLLEESFRNPPRQARVHCYWWWLNGNTDEATITRDLEAMHDKGYGGVILIDANGASQNGNNPVAAGPTYGSGAWRKLYLHALREAARLDLEISLTIESGWNLGGPGVKSEHASKILTWSRVQVNGPKSVSLQLDRPPSKNDWYRDIAVLAYPLHHGAALPARPVRQLDLKAVFKEAGFSVPDSRPLLEDIPPEPSEEDTRVNEVQNISAFMGPGGELRWQIPAGDWELLRIGYTNSGAKVSTSSGAWQGLAIDHLDRAAFADYWQQTVEPLLSIAKPYQGKTLRYLVTDSWELGGTNWSSRYAAAFRRDHGYDALPFLPIVTGRIVESREVSNRFLNDFRRTIGNLVISEHYQQFADSAARHGLGIHPESGGPHGAPVDALETLGVSTFPQTEYWAPSKEHRTGDRDRFFVKEAASAGHIYGKSPVAAEGMTSIGPQWQESPGRDLKPAFDQALCEGLNLLVWHTFTSSPKQAGLPGQEYFAGTHMNPNITWWNDAAGFLATLSRSAFLMQQGLPVSDVLYYYGDQVPNFVQNKNTDPAQVLPNYDYDVVNEQVLTTKLSVKDHRLMLPNGTSYRLLMLSPGTTISEPAIAALKRLASAGAFIAGIPPTRTTGLVKGVVNDNSVARSAAALWQDCKSEHVFCNAPGRELLQHLGVQPDLEGLPNFDFIHRRTTGADIYFVRNTSGEAIEGEAVFRVTAMQPELWNAETTAITNLPGRSTSDRRTAVTLKLLPHGSAFVVFRKPLGSGAPQPEWVTASTVDLNANWAVTFDPARLGPGTATFASLVSWTARSEPGIRFYSGTARYRKQVTVSAADLANGAHQFLDLGNVREVAHLYWNGKDLGAQWHAPYRWDVSAAAKAGENVIEIDVTNLWPNRLIGDASLPPLTRFTKTNIAKYTPSSPLIDSGILGPVVLLRATSH